MERFLRGTALPCRLLLALALAMGMTDCRAQGQRLTVEIEGAKGPLQMVYVELDTLSARDPDRITIGNARVEEVAPGRFVANVPETGMAFRLSIRSDRDEDELFLSQILLPGERMRIMGKLGALGAGMGECPEYEVSGAQVRELERKMREATCGGLIEWLRTPEPDLQVVYGLLDSVTLAKKAYIRSHPECELSGLYLSKLNVSFGEFMQLYEGLDEKIRNGQLGSLLKYYREVRELHSRGGRMLYDELESGPDLGAGERK